MNDPVVNTLITDACANNGAWLHYAAYLFGASAGASLLANFRKLLPPWTVPILDTMALNFVKGLPAAPVTPPAQQ